MRLRGLIAVGAVLVVVLAAATAAFAAPPFRTAVFDPETFSGPDAATAFARTQAAGAQAVRLIVAWSVVEHYKPPTPAKAQDPKCGCYDWSGVDAQVDAAVAHGLTPILDVIAAPPWENSGDPSLPDVTALATFAKVLATHYDGTTKGQPRVSDFMLWNEPNLSTTLKPQTPVAATWYRNALNAFSASIHGVHADNVVIGGGLAPYEEKPGPGVATTGLAPMTFIRDVFCMSAAAKPKPTCSDGASVDVWAFHPYTYGQPTDKAHSPNDIAAGDIPRAQALLRAAQKAGHLHAHGALQFWVTEFSYDTNPPDPKALPYGLQARWTSQALYEFWKDGISLVTWFLLRDEPRSESFQSGLYLAGSSLAADRPKPTLTAFRFPFVATLTGKSYELWGRTPGGVPGTVVVQRQVGSKWVKLLSLRAGAGGIFHTKWATPLRAGNLRAVLGKQASLPYGLKAPPDRQKSPFGSG